ncbi:MAG TPA: response regulator [Bryobacteraceae bacterium]|nr:response regulator [Bryobacteraceae bacterium]
MNDPVDILLVEDNPSDAELTMHVLERHNLAERVYVVHDGAEALDFVFGTGDYAGRDAANFPKMMLLDLKLPKIDGLEVLRRVKAEPRTRSIPVVVFSSSWEDRDLKAAQDLGADKYVVKPVDFAQFAEAVRAVLASGQGVR